MAPELAGAAMLEPSMAIKASAFEMVANILQFVIHELLIDKERYHNGITQGAENTAKTSNIYLHCDFRSISASGNSHELNFHFPVFYRLNTLT